MTTWEEHKQDALRADSRAHGHDWDFDPAVGAPRLRAFASRGQLIAYPDSWEVRWRSGEGLSDLSGFASSYANAQSRADVAYRSLLPLLREAEKGGD